MEEETLDYEETGKLPVFLKVLCILTFIGSGIGILMAIYSMTNMNASIEQLEESRRAFEQARLGSLDGQIAATEKWGMFSYIMSFVGSSLCLLGALLMWRLKKIGYFLYIPGHIIPLVASFIFANSMGSGSGFMSSFVYIALIFQVVLAIAFIIMYGVNFKHLK